MDRRRKKEYATIQDGYSFQKKDQSLWIDLLLGVVYINECLLVKVAISRNE